MSANFTIQLSVQALSIFDNKLSNHTAGNFIITYSCTEYGFNPILIETFYIIQKPII